MFSGGEPTLQRGLPDAVREVRELGFKVGLHTAGCYPERLDELLPALDWVGLDIKALPQDYAALTGVPGSGERAFESLQFLVESGVAHEVQGDGARRPVAGAANCGSCSPCSTRPGPPR